MGGHALKVEDLFKVLFDVDCCVRISDRDSIVRVCWSMSSSSSEVCVMFVGF
jgi:hypothetical protein